MLFASKLHVDNTILIGMDFMSVVCIQCYGFESKIELFKLEYQKSLQDLTLTALLMIIIIIYSSTVGLKITT